MAEAAEPSAAVPDMDEEAMMASMQLVRAAIWEGPHTQTEHRSTAPPPPPTATHRPLTAPCVTRCDAPLHFTGPLEEEEEKEEEEG